MENPQTAGGKHTSRRPKALQVEAWLWAASKICALVLNSVIHLCILITNSCLLRLAPVGFYDFYLYVK